MHLTEKQVQRLLTPVRPSRVSKKQGLTYVPAHEVRAELCRTFGPGNWDSRIHDVSVMYETSYDKDGKTYWLVCYRAACTLRVRDYDGNPICEFTEYHVEENAPQPNRGEAHALAMTSVASYALRRAAIGLGDGMGLHLYNEGSMSALVKGSLMQEEVFGESPDGAVSPEQAENLRTTLGAEVVDESTAAAPETEPEGVSS